MSFLKNIINNINKKIPKGAFYGATNYELKNMLCGTGSAEISSESITVTDYPFEPSTVYPGKVISVESIGAVCLGSHPPFLKIKNEAIFVSKKQLSDLEFFAVKNQIPQIKDTNNWTWILEPFLDTEYTGETNKKVIELLAKNGISEKEIYSLRAEVEEQMMKYNFDTMLWEWGMLGLLDVLSAMRVKYDKVEYKDFYERAMEIQFRQNP